MILLIISGSKYLMYASPVLLIAILGCVYLHIAKKANECDIDM
jgi:hypothetical protein